MTSPLLGLAKTIGKAFNSIFLDATLTRDIPGSTEPPYSPFNPGPPSSQSFTMKAIAEEYSAGTRGQGLVGATDMRVLILTTSLKTQPQPLDRIIIPAMGFSGQIVPGDAAGVKPVATDPAKATWQARCST